MQVRSRFPIFLMVPPPTSCWSLDNSSRSLFIIILRLLLCYLPGQVTAVVTSPNSVLLRESDWLAGHSDAESAS